MDAHNQETQQQENCATVDRQGNNTPKQRAPITAAENQPITAEHPALKVDT